MKKVYAIIHYYDEDSGHGDVICEEQLVAIFEYRKMAEAFIEKFQKPHVYAITDARLYCGNLEIREIAIFEHLYGIDAKNFWWLTNRVIEVEE